jgi:hypothetical protein
VNLRRFSFIYFDVNKFSVYPKGVFGVLRSFFMSLDLGF